MTREETIKAIKIMQHFVDGGDIEVSTKNDACFNRIPCDNPDIKAKEILWNWEAYDYRIKPQQVSIPATEEELERINRKTVWIKNKRNPDCMGHVLANDKIIDENWLVFNPDTKCWEDWKNK